VNKKELLTEEEILKVYKQLHLPSEEIRVRYLMRFTESDKKYEGVRTELSDNTTPLC